jgi:hypothetical protein
MKLLKCADGLRRAIGCSETSVPSLLGEIRLLIVYLVIYILFVGRVAQSV